MLSFRFLTVTFFLILFTACASNSSYKYYAEPTVLKKGITQYHLEDVTVNLTLGHGAIPDDTTFVDQEALEKSFSRFLISKLQSERVLASDQASSDAVLNITINYERRFNWGGKALNKPGVSFIANVTRNGELLASVSRSQVTTKYGKFKDIAVNAEISAFKWGAEDEPKDVEKVSEAIVHYIVNFGK